MRALWTLPATNERASTARRRSGLGPAELLAAEQDVAGAGGVDPGDQPAGFIQERQGDARLGAEFDGPLLTTAGPKHGDTVEVVDGYPGPDLLLDLDDDRLAIAVEVAAGGGDVERAEVDLHGISLRIGRASHDEPAGETPENLRLMRLIDEQYTAYPFYGSRRMTRWLIAPMSLPLPDIPESESTPLVRQLLDLIGHLQNRIQELEDEILRSKGLKTRPSIAPSPLETPPRPPREPGQKRPGSAKRLKTAPLTPTNQVVPLADPPSGSVFKGYEDFVVQDLIILLSVGGSGNFQ